MATATLHELLVLALVRASMAQQFPCTGCFCKPTWNETALQVTNDIPFGEALNSKTKITETLHLNLYEPPSDDTRTARPAMICIHGGGFSKGDRNKVEFVKWAKHFASRGFVAVSIDYRLEANRPPHRGNMSGANLDAMYDAKAAVRWLQKNRAQYHIDPHRIAAFGGSAGAMTVAYLTAVPGEGNSGNPGYLSNITAGVSLSGTLQPQVWGDIDATDPPYIDFHGSADPTIPIVAAQATKAAMDKAGAVNALVTLQGQKHVPFPALENHIGTVMGFLTKYMDLASAQCPKVQGGVVIV